MGAVTHRFLLKLKEGSLTGTVENGGHRKPMVKQTTTLNNNDP